MALLGGVWTATGVVLYLIAPLAAPAVLGLAVVAPLAWCWAAEARLAWRTPSPVVAVLAMAAAYLLINASWSLSRSEAYASVAMLAAAIAVLHLTTLALPAMPPPALRAMGLGLLVGLAIAAAVVCFEALSDQWLRRLLAGQYAWLRPHYRHLHMEAGRVTYLEPYLLNRSMSALGLLFWPALLVLERLALGRRQHVLALAGLCLAPIAIWASHHGTSKLAFAGAAAIYGIARLAPILARRLLISGWLVATLLVAPLAALAFGNNLHLARWLDHSIRHRIVIWEYSSSEIAKAPLLGAGINSLRALHNPNAENAPRVPGTDFPAAAPLHSHNAYLQVWHEAGAIGAGLLLVLGLVILRTIAGQPHGLQHGFYATFAAGALLAASSFSLWAPWFLSALTLTAVFACLGAALPAPAGNSRGPL
jgi:hypothetical protein